MKTHTSEWIRLLSKRERKDLVCLLFELRRHLEGHRHYDLFEEFLKVIDEEHHDLKMSL